MITIKSNLAKTLLAGAVAFAQFATPQVVYAASIVVQTNADNTTTNGLCSLREAITNANSDAATFADCPAGTGNDTITFNAGMTITLGSTLPNISDADGLTVNGAGAVTISGGNAVRIFIVNSSVPLTLSNLTLSNGAVTTSNGGAALVNSNATLTINGSTFSNNNAVGNSGIPTPGHGGALFLDTGTTANISNSTFSGNTTAYGYGGAIYVNAATVTITDSTFTNNASEVDAFGNFSLGGAAIQNNDGTVTIIGSTFSGNNVTGFGPDGGAIFNGDFDGDAPDIMTITNSTLYNNYFVYVGGTGSSAGGAIRSNSTITVTHSTFSNNDPGITAGVPEGAVTIASGTGTLIDNIFANTNGAGFDCRVRPGATLAVSSGGNLIESNSSCGTPVSTGDPALGALANNGGPTQTIALGALSPAVNALASCAAGVTVDQRGVARPQPTGGNCDIGAYELDNAAPTVTINQAVGQADPTNGATINFTVVFSEPVAGFATGDVGFTGSTAGGVLTGTVSGGPTTYTVAVTGMTTTGTVVASIPAGVATDTALNNNTASTSTDNTVVYDVTGPTVNIVSVSPDPTSAGTTVTWNANENGTFSVRVGGTNCTDGTVAVSGGYATSPANLASAIVAGDLAAGLNNLRVCVTDAATNTGSATSSVTKDTTDPTVNIVSVSPDPTSAGTTVTWNANENGTFSVRVGGTNCTDGTVAASGNYVTSPANVASAIVAGDLAAGLNNLRVCVTDAAINQGSTTGTVTVDTGFPTVTASTPANSASVTGPTQLTVTFSEDISAITGNSAANYLLLNDNGDGFDDVPTVMTCLTGINPNGGNDLNIPVDSATYPGGSPFLATLGINGGVALPVGTYRLYVCGTTSIEDLAGNELNNGLNDTIINFTVIPGAAGGGGGGNARASLIPATGFPQGELTSLPVQPADKAYAATDLWIEIPKLNIKMSIVGVPQTKDGWDVQWLGRDAGWLNGSAYPTWNGNSVITGHVWDALNKPGPFALLKDLKYGDQVTIHAFGQVFTYEIRETSLVLPKNISSMLKHEEKSWLTLITCETFNEKSQSYSYRRMVRAVLVRVTAEK